MIIDILLYNFFTNIFELLTYKLSYYQNILLVHYYNIYQLFQNVKILGYIKSFNSIKLYHFYYNFLNLLVF